MAELSQRTGGDVLPLVRLSDAFAQCARKHPFCAIAVDECESPPCAIVGVHAAAGDVEPPSAQAQRTGGDALAHDLIGRQMFQLNKNVELRQLVVHAQARVKCALMLKAESSRTGMMQPFGEVGRPDLLFLPQPSSLRIRSGRRR